MNSIEALNYVKNNINSEPAKTIKFLITNKQYFPNIDYRWVGLLLKKYNLTDADIRSADDVLE